MLAKEKLFLIKITYGFITQKYLKRNKIGV